MTQTKFMGATVAGFTCNVGWNEQASSLTVTLVEDAGDRFERPAAGTPAAFEMGGFRFEGLVQHSDQQTDVSGRRKTVVLTDPREVLDGVKVITSSYSAPVPVPNVLNAYGYWEDVIGFGGAMTNEAGMLWQAPYDAIRVGDGGGISVNPVAAVGVKPAVEAMTGGGGRGFGGPIQFRGHSYPVDLSGLPATPASYRIGDFAPSLLEIVSQICQDAGCDYMVRLEGGVIRFKTVSRTAQPQPGQVAAYVQGRPDAVVRSFGTELRNDVTNVLLVGGKVTELVQVTGSGASNAIMPYWGKDVDGKVIVGDGDPSSADYKVDLNAKDVVDVVGGTTYRVDLAELRCSLSDTGFESWAAYVMKNDPDKAKAIGLANSVDSDSDLAELFPDGLFRRDLIALRDEDMKRFGQMNEADWWTSRAERVFDFVRRAASEYFGARFMVRIPFLVYWKVEPETYQVVASDEVSQEGGYLPEGASPLGLPYYEVNKFTTEDGRFECFVEFALDEKMNLQDLSPEDYAVANNRLFLRASADQEIVYPGGSVYPYAVVSLPQPVYQVARDPLGGVEDVSKVLGVTPDALATAVGLRYGSFPVRIHPSPYMPDGAAVPMKSNRATYGPWGTFSGSSATGVPGKTFVRQEESLTPWGFGDWDTMNKAAEALVAGAATNMQEGETGLIEVPGLPDRNAGDALVAGGPSVTTVDCKVATSGVTTTYTLKTFTPQFGAFQRQNAERLKRLGLAAMQTRRAVRAALQRRASVNAVRARASYGAAANTALAVRQMTPHDTVMAGMWKSDAHGYRTQAAFATVDEFMANVRADRDDYYKMTGGMGLEGLYRPFSTATDKDDAGDMPHLEDPADGVNLALQEKNPFSFGDVDILVSGQKYADAGTLHRLKGDLDYDHARPVGHHTPLFLVGWGRETTGKPFPNKGDESQPLHQWSDDWDGDAGTTPEKFRAGRLDVRWDNWRKCWSVPTLLEGKLDADLTGVGPVNVTVWVNDKATPDKVKAVNKLGGVIKAGTYVYLTFSPTNNRWLVTGVACS